MNRGGLLELFGDIGGREYRGLYRIDSGSKEHKQEIFRWIEDGRVRLGHVNGMKYQGREIRI